MDQREREPTCKTCFLRTLNERLDLLVCNGKFEYSIIVLSEGSHLAYSYNSLFTLKDRMESNQITSCKRLSLPFSEPGKTLEVVLRLLSRRGVM